MIVDTNKSSTRLDQYLFFFLASYYSASTIMPIVPHYINTYIYLGTVILLICLMVMRNYETFNTYIIFLMPLLAIIILQIINTYFNHLDSVPLFIYDRLIYIFPPLLMYYLLINNKRSIVRGLIFIMVGSYIITAFTTYIGLLSNPDAARYLASVADSKDALFIELGIKNIGGFETIYSLVILFPMIICLYKNKKMHIIIFLGSTIIIMFCLLQAQYTTALLLFFISFILVFAKKRFLSKNVWILISIAILAYFIFRPMISDLFRYLSLNTESYTLAERFSFIADSISGIKNNSDVGNRIDLYLLSIKYFFKYPITGAWLFVRYGNGGHSFILDTLGQFGIFGGIALYIFFRQIYRKLYMPYKTNEYYGYMLWSFILFIALSFVNPTNFLLVLCFITPGIAYILQNKDYRLNSKGVPSLEDNVGL